MLTGSAVHFFSMELSSAVYLFCENNSVTPFVKRNSVSSKYCHDFTMTAVLGAEDITILEKAKLDKLKRNKNNKIPN